MFSNPIKSLFFRISTKINFVYSLVLILAFFFLFLGLYVQIKSAYTEDYRSHFQDYLLEVESRVSELGVESTKDFYKEAYRFSVIERFVVFYMDGEGKAHFLATPTGPQASLINLEEIRDQVNQQKVSDFSFEVDKNGQIFYVNGRRSKNQSVYAIIDSGSYINEKLAIFRTKFLKVFIPTALVSLLIGFLLAYKFTRPLRDILQSITSIEKGSLSTRIPLSGTGDEIEEIKKHFNSLLDKIQSLVNGLRGAFDNLAHDIRTPVTRLRGRAEITLNDDSSDLETYKDALQTCFENSDKILSFLQTLTDITEAEHRSRDLRIQKIYISDLINEMVDLYEMAFEEKEIQLLKQLDKNDWAMIDPKLISRVIANLLDNAHKFSPAGSKVVIETINSIEHVVIKVTDEGIGIAPEEQNLIFDKLYRSDKSRTEYGMGLGLTFVKAVVSAHDGKVSVKSPVKDGRGTQFEVLLYKMR